MFSSLVRSCGRNGKRISVQVANLYRFPPTEFAVERIVTETQPPPRSSRLFTTTQWTLSHGQTIRCFSAFVPGDADPHGSAPEPEIDFGSLSTDISSRRSFKKSSPDIRDWKHQDDEEDLQPSPRWRPRRKNTPYWYFLQCKKLIKASKLQEALELFRVDMLQGERLQPEEFNYTVLIGGCGRKGQLKQAFKLYNDMKKRGLKPTDATYTALFNACAEALSKPAGLQQALKLEQELSQKNYPLSTITYHALLKTHAITNDLQACMHTFREMLQKGHAVTQETFHYLLMGCLRDKDVGFRLALQVWRQMLKAGMQPDTQNYNLLLRTARDCGIGDPVLASDVLLRTDRECQTGREPVSCVKSDSKDPIDIKLLEEQLFIQPDSRRKGHQGSRRGEESSSGGLDSTSLIPLGQNEDALLPFHAAPNLLELFEGKDGSGVISLGTINGASDRLALIGGGEGFLEKMVSQGLRPDLRTLTLLADTMEHDSQSLRLLLRAAKQHKVKVDVAFFNSVIRQAARAGDLDGAKAVVGVMRQYNLRVDIQTFGCLALGCMRKEDGLQLLSDMQEAGFRPNLYVFSALIGRAARRLDYIYLKTLLRSMRDMNVWPNEVIIRQLEFAAQYPPNYDKYKSRNNYLIQIDGFRGYYKEWLHSMPAAQDGEDKQAVSQTETLPAVIERKAADGRTEAQRSQRPAASTHRSHKNDKRGSAAAAL
ncbi:pentatricopeptide repeat-containing protein 1, mitochondrial [Aulostomus maculatus]